MKQQQEDKSLVDPETITAISTNLIRLSKHEECYEYLLSTIGTEEYFTQFKGLTVRMPLKTRLTLLMRAKALSDQLQRTDSSV
jgi:hypothetical protein